MAGLILIALLVGLCFMFGSSGLGESGSNSNRSSSYSEQQRWADEFEMDSYDDEQFLGDDD